jgi:PAS domain S-box-containing protein
MEKKKLRNSSTGEPQQSQTVLIVEDDQALSKLLQRNLRRLGLEVEIALTGADAIDRVAGGRFDLALLDYRLSDMTGIKVIETLAGQKHTIPFIVTTGFGDERTAVELMKLGARDYLVKDATFLDRLPQVVERTLQELDMERRLAKAERSLQKQTQELAKRMKELRCLFSLDELMKQEDITVKKFLDRLVSFIPAAMQYPEISNACITLDGKRHKNKGFKKTEWMLQDDIVIGGKKAGSVQVCYSEERPEADIGPFLKEEKALVSSIAKQVGIYIEGRRSREALRESEEKIRNIFESTYESILVTDNAGNIIEANDAIARSHGYTHKEELIGKNSIELVAEKDRSRIAKDTIEAAKESRSYYKGVYTLLRADGTEFEAEYGGTVLYDSSGKPSGYIEIGRASCRERVFGLV